MSYEIAVQSAVYAALFADVTLAGLVTAIYDAVPQDTAFPYVSIGESNFNEWDTDTSLGKDCSITIHTWSRYRGKKQTFQIQAAIRDVLHRAELTYTGYRFILTEEQETRSMMDQDGLTRHGISTYRIVLDRN